MWTDTNGRDDMAIKDCRTCMHMMRIRNKRTTCRQYVLVEGIVKDEMFERPYGKCRHYKRRNEDMTHVDGK